jgi:hypothetical protein
VDGRPSQEAVERDDAFEAMGIDPAHDRKKTVTLCEAIQLHPRQRCAHGVVTP